jgi:hypothetical protein
LIAAYKKHGSVKRAVLDVRIGKDRAREILREAGVLAPHGARPAKPAAQRAAATNPASWAYSEPTPSVVIGRVIDPDKLANRILRAVADLGAVQLICHRGRFAAAIPGSRMSRLAERAKPCAIVGTYVSGVSRAAVLADIRHEMEACA